MRKVYLDMDGVIVDFIDGFFRLAGWNDDMRQRWQPDDFYLTTLGMTAPFFNELVTRAGADFWVGLEPYPGALELATLLLDHPRCLLLTAPTPDPYAATGKMAWLHKHLPRHVDRYIFTRHKEFLATPDALLIDDHAENIRKFEERGGRGLLVPRHWNPLHTTQPYGLTPALIQQALDWLEGDTHDFRSDSDHHADGAEHPAGTISARSSLFQQRLSSVK